MSAEGATDLLSQTLAKMARKVDMAAEARGTLDSVEFLAFRDLVKSIYVGQLQKRVSHVEERGKTNINPSSTGTECPIARQGEQSQQTTRTPGAQNERKTRSVPFLATYPRQNTQQNHCNSNGSSGNSSTGAVASAGYQSCSGDIAQALVAIATGEGFDMLCSARPADTGNIDRLSDVDGGKLIGPMLRDRTHTSRLDSTAGDRHDGGGGLSLSRRRDASKSNSSKMELEAGEALQYLSEDSALTTGRGEDGKVEAATGRQPGCSIPGLDWLASHIVGRSIPMTLR